MDRYTGSAHTRTAAAMIGIGLGGFVDGIALHQIAQWHSMFSARIPPTTMEAMKTNMRADGWFHAAVFVVTFVGILNLYRAAQRGAAFPSMRWFIGLLIGGWGAFNLVEAVIDHHLLQLHHVRDLPAHAPAYDYGFLLLCGVGFLVIGWLLARGQGNGRPRAIRN